MYINIQKVLYKSKFDALSIRTRRIALKRSFTNISLGESSPNFAFVPLYKKKKRTSLRILSTPRFEKSRFQLKEEKSKLKIYFQRKFRNSIFSLSLHFEKSKQISISSNETNSLEVKNISKFNRL